MPATKGGRRLIVWRHGETDHNAGGIWQGQLDTALSAKGREQARAAAAALTAYSPAVIVSSDLERGPLTRPERSHHASACRCGTTSGCARSTPASGRV